MRLTMTTKISSAVAGVIALALISSLVGLASSRQIGHLMEQTVTENVSSVQAAEELEISLLEQKGLVSFYILDGGNRRWLTQLADKKKNLVTWLGKARETAHTEDEKAILAELEAMYRDLNQKRDEVVALYDRGEIPAAERLLLDEVSPIYVEAFNLCEDFLAANEKSVERATDRARSDVRRVTWLVGSCVGLSILVGGGLLWLYFFGIVLPLRSLVTDARSFSAGKPVTGRELPTDELQTVGAYLRNLMSDVTSAQSALEQTRAQLQQAERLASVGKLAASVAHEIRNPLTAIKMWLFSIQKSVGGTPEIDRRFRIVSDEILRLENIVRNFLEFSRPPELKCQVESVGDLLSKALDLIGPRIAEGKIRLVRRDQPQLPAVSADAAQFMQVLLNLLTNALDVTGEGGEITVTSSLETDVDGRSIVVVRVRDTGPGMPEEVSRRIFEPFFTTKDGGVGLGLCIAARIMVRHQGRLLLESSSGRGTVFTLWLPAITGPRP